MHRPTDHPDAHDLDVIYYLIGKPAIYGLQGVDAENSAAVFKMALENAGYAMRDLCNERCPYCTKPIIDTMSGWQCGCGSWTDNPEVRQQACKATAEAILAISCAGYYDTHEVATPSQGASV